jgi:hypothetical protein
MGDPPGCCTTASASQPAAESPRTAAAFPQPLPPAPLVSAKAAPGMPAPAAANVAVSMTVFAVQ